MTVSDGGMSVTSVPTIWGNVPQRNKNFTGRVDILARLRQGASSRITAVLPDQDPDDPLPQAVQGLGGVGKTAIAIEYAYRHRSDYDLVWWIPADQLPSVRASLAQLAGRLGVEVTASGGIDGAISAVLDALRRGDPHTRWLLIFDNADQPEDIIDLIPSGPGDVLITSRNHRWQSVIDTVPMDVFERLESTEFLERRVGAGISRQEADRLAEQLGDLPLALEQAGAMLAETGMPVDEYLRLLDEHVSGIMSEGKSPDYPMSMTAAWKLSVTTLQEQLPQARELLRCCAFFGPEPIPRDVFRQGGQATRTPLGSMISDPILLARAIRELGRFALVTLDGRSVSVHRLIQALLRDELTHEEQAEYRREVHLILAAAAPKDPDNADLWLRWQDLLPHVASESTELAKSRAPAVRELALNTMRYLYQSGDYTSCRDLTERFIEQWTKDSGPDSPDVLEAQRHLGNVLRLLGRYQESFDLTFETLEKSRGIMGESDSLTLHLRNSFGADLRARGDFRQALELDGNTGTLLQEAYGPEHPRTLRLLSSLGLDYILTSQYGGAKDLFQSVFPLMSQVAVDTTSADVLAVWNGLAWALRLLGEYRAAFDVLQEALDYGQEALGPEHIATLRSTNAFTIVCRRFPDRRAEALETLRSILELSERLFGPEHPDTLGIVVSLSNLLRTISGEYHEEALRLADSTVARFPEAYGPQHPYYFGCVGNQALLRRITGDAVTARRLNEEALAGLDDRLGRDHHYTLTVATNLASDLSMLGLSEEARVLGEQTYDRLEALMGPGHPATLACAANLALDRIATGDEIGGQALRDKTVDLYRTLLGEQNPDTVVAVSGSRLDPDFDPLPI
ncbi:MAG TPA: FxSxx-COOH system tetratricopeptide repeat protein [Trebonia sp.]|nr:FxSxx-COOH system tetratricopeptide repeat protein [Trebonia sp.]